MTDTNDVLRVKLDTAWRFFYNRGFVDGFGHISARTERPDHILITPHDLGRRSKPGDFVLVDLDGNQIGSDVKLPGELPIHLDVYKARPDVHSVAHFHCLYPTSFSMSSVEMKPTYFMASIFRDGVPIHPDSRLVLNRERGAALAETLGSHRAALMKAHGVVITGGSVEEMTAVAYILEENAHRTWVTATMGEVEYLSDETMAEIEAELLKTRAPFKRIWTLCCNEAAEAEQG
jgi:ribulose-5-phosphate 4-epimerase/fuculose-1-phosphate aldolase